MKVLANDRCPASGGSSPGRNSTRRYRFGVVPRSTPPVTRTRPSLSATAAKSARGWGSWSYSIHDSSTQISVTTLLSRRQSPVSLPTTRAPPSPSGRAWGPERPSRIVPALTQCPATDGVGFAVGEGCAAGDALGPTVGATVGVAAGELHAAGRSAISSTSAVRAIAPVIPAFSRAIVPLRLSGRTGRGRSHRARPKLRRRAASGVAAAIGRKDPRHRRFGTTRPCPDSAVSFRGVRDRAAPVASATLRPAVVTAEDGGP